MHLTVAPKCPDCQTRDGIHRIEYGASARAGVGRYVVADHEPQPDSPKWGCVTCGWRLPAWWADRKAGLADAYDEAPYDQHAEPPSVVESHSAAAEAALAEHSSSAVA